MPTIHLSSITTYSISFQLENDIRKKALSEEDIAHVHEIHYYPHAFARSRFKIL